eukprot:TRINITY_DN24502_c0_g1_i1.p1 TRINITY_DN24502_c0_g1~~TRINITY_DN24502_c0_g1_i1.p1  ORF type:complete len:278 (-),score=29.17 TRINITY_DN24502_c0_g1_i1:117-950(-)
MVVGIVCSISLLLFCASTVAIAYASPTLSVASNLTENINHGYESIISTPNDLKNIAERPITPTTEQAAGIQNSRLVYYQTTGVVTGIILPANSDILIKARMHGSVSFEGKLASDIEFETERLLQNYSQSFQQFYAREKVRLQTRAGSAYFCFFQAAYNYGFSDEQSTREVLQSGEFRDFRDKVRVILSSQTTTTLSANFETEFEGRSAGYRETITAFGYVYINQVVLSSGDTFIVAKRNSELFVADQNGRIHDKEIITIESARVSANLLDTELSSGS